MAPKQEKAHRQNARDFAKHGIAEFARAFIRSWRLRLPSGGPLVVLVSTQLVFFTVIVEFSVILSQVVIDALFAICNE